MSATVTSAGTTWAAAPPVKVMEPGHWSSASVGNHYDISPDGKRFLVMDPPHLQPVDLNIIQNWYEELKALAPSK